MFKFIKCLLGVHDFETVEQGKISSRRGEGFVGYFKHCKCKNCGTWKKFDLV